MRRATSMGPPRRCWTTWPRTAYWTGRRRQCGRRTKRAHGRRAAARGEASPERGVSVMSEHAPAAAEEAIDFSDYRGVWVYIQQRDGVAGPAGWQLLGQAASMAKELGTEVGAVVIGHNVCHLAEDAIAYGADVVYLVDNPVLAKYRTQAYGEAFAEVCRRRKPEIVLFGSTNDGRDLAGAVATILKTGLTADGTMLSVEPDTRILHASRPDFGGKLMSTILCKRHRPQMATCRPGVFEALPADRGRKGQIVEESVTLDEEQIATKV